MISVFLSYAHEDQERVRELIAALKGQQLDVWWDERLKAGDRFDDELQQRIKAASCTVVVWSQHARKSRYVVGEAMFAGDLKRLVPARIDSTGVLLGMASLQVADLSDWAGDVRHRGFRQLLEGIKAFGGEPRAAADETTPPVIDFLPAPPTGARPYRRALLVVAVAALVMTTAGLVYLSLSAPRYSQLRGREFKYGSPESPCPTGSDTGRSCLPGESATEVQVTMQPTRVPATSSSTCDDGITARCVLLSARIPAGARLTAIQTSIAREGAAWTICRLWDLGVESFVGDADCPNGSGNQTEPALSARFFDADVASHFWSGEQTVAIGVKAWTTRESLTPSLRIYYTRTPER